MIYYRMLKPIGDWNSNGPFPSGAIVEIACEQDYGDARYFLRVVEGPHAGNETDWSEESPDDWFNVVEPLTGIEQLARNIDDGPEATT